MDKLIQTIENGRLKIDVEDRRSRVERNIPPSNIHPPHPSSTLNPPSSKLFNAITMFQLIEHLKNPLPLLLSAKRLLKKNGVILITTPNNDSPLRKIFGSSWSVYNEPSHFVFYNKKILKQTLEISGFKNIQTKLDQMRFLSLKYILNRLIQIYPSSIFNLLASNFQLLTSNIPIPTDPFGDLEAIGFKS